MKPSPKPLLVVAHDDPAVRSVLEDELARRYVADYDVHGCSTDEMEAVLDGAHDVAVVLAAGTRGAGLLSRVRHRFPAARRGLLIPWLGWADEALAESVLSAMALGWIDLYVLEPAPRGAEDRRDEIFHRTVAELLQESARLKGEGPAGATVVAGNLLDPRAHALRATLSGFGIPHVVAPDPRGGGAPPRVELAGGVVLEDPSAAELARALGFPTELDREHADVVVVGAGPAGLGAAVNASSEGLLTTVLDGSGVGGQAGSSSLIRNYLGFPRGLGGGELAQRMYQQAWLFKTRFRLTERVVALARRGPELVVTAADGMELTARAVVLALGVEYRRLEAAGLAELEGAGVFYGASMSDAQALAGEAVFVVGGGNSAGQSALHFARYAAEVTIVVRGEDLDDSMSRYLIDALDAAPNVSVRYETEVARAFGEGRLEGLELRTADGRTERVDAAALVVLIGAHPHTEWLPPELARDERGYILTGEPAGAARPLETSMPGVFAAGDVRAGGVKRVAAAVGDGALAVTNVHAYLADEAAGWPASG